MNQQLKQALLEFKKGQRQVKCQARLDGCIGSIFVKETVKIKLKRFNNKTLVLCPKCFKQIYTNEIRNTDDKVINKALKDSFYYQEGARAIDLKSYIDKWTKQLTQQI